jgi:hypothetical protein
MSNKTLYKDAILAHYQKELLLQDGRCWAMSRGVQRTHPTQSSLCFVVDSMNILPGRRGRQRMLLLKILREDLSIGGLV